MTTQEYWPGQWGYNDCFGWYPNMVDYRTPSAYQQMPDYPEFPVNVLPSVVFPVIPYGLCPDTPVIRTRVGDQVTEGPKVTDDVLRTIAKKNCRRCLGRGKIIFDNPDGTGRDEACPCIFKRKHG